MASPISPAFSSQTPFNPLSQTFYLKGPHNAEIPVWIPAVDETLRLAFNTAICYACQIGASFVMLLVVLTMTSRTRFSRASTLISVAALAANTVRFLLMAVYFGSSFLEFYVLFSGDSSFISLSDAGVSAAASCLAVPVLLLVQAALFLQAYSMIQLWPPAWKAAALALSALIAAAAVGFDFASIVVRMRYTLAIEYIPEQYLWLSRADLAATATSVFWFCFVFIVRLVIHMWDYRSILPPIGGLSAMEVLVMTNGILMLVPVLLASMELAKYTKFETGTLCITSVVIVLPLGTLIAQNMTGANGYASHGNGSGSRSGGFAGSANPGSSGRQGSCSRAPPDMAHSKKLFFGSWSRSSDGTAALVSGGLATQTKIRSGHGGGELSPAPSSPTKSKTLDPVDQELQRIDATPTGPYAEGQIGSARGVWVGHKVEVHTDLV